MKAMILAAGLGTRLRPLTDDRPKALVEVAGHTLLEITLARLRSLGVDDVIINVHHFADKMLEYLKANDNFGMRIEVSREDVLLDTGGGLKNAAPFFLGTLAQASLEGQLLSSSDGEEPFLLHNVDVISTIDLPRMLQFHAERGALATLAVQDRETSRYLLFDARMQLCGRRSGRDGKTELSRPEPAADDPPLTPLAFSGIHVISTRLLTKMTEQGVFSIIDAYLRLAGAGERIIAFRADQYYWRDLGKPESVTRAAQDLREGKFSVQ
jgi:NDP-sugar pyrophosphorylase family protein